MAPDYNENKKELDDRRRQDWSRQQASAKQDSDRQQAAEMQDKNRQRVASAHQAYKTILNPLGAAANYATKKGLDYADKRYGSSSIRKGPFVAAFLAAILKDLMDLSLVGSLPGLGTAITLCASIFIGMMLILAGGYKKKNVAIQTIKRFLVLILGTLTELLFGFNFLPMETITVGIIYWMTKKEAKQERK